MAVKEVAQQPIDLASTDAGGAPLVQTDATHTGGAVTPTAVGAAAVGTAVTASPADHAHEGVHSVKSDANPQLTGDVILASGTGVALSQVGNTITVATSGASVNKVTWADDREKSNVGASEEILFEWVINFDDAGGANVQARLTAAVAATAGTATYNLYVGATALGSTAGATARATITATTNTMTPKTNLGAAFANPTGAVIVQLAAANSAGGNKNKIRAIECSLG